MPSAAGSGRRRGACAGRALGPRGTVRPLGTRLPAELVGRLRWAGTSVLPVGWAPAARVSPSLSGPAISLQQGLP